MLSIKYKKGCLQDSWVPFLKRLKENTVNTVIKIDEYALHSGRKKYEGIIFATALGWTWGKNDLVSLCLRPGNVVLSRKQRSPFLRITELWPWLLRSVKNVWLLLSSTSQRALSANSVFIPWCGWSSIFPDFSVWGWRTQRRWKLLNHIQCTNQFECVLQKSPISNHKHRIHPTVNLSISKHFWVDCYQRRLWCKGDACACFLMCWSQTKILCEYLRTLTSILLV